MSDRDLNRLYAQRVLGRKLLAAGAGACDVYAKGGCRYVCGVDFVADLGRRAVELALMKVRSTPSRQ